MNVLVIVAAVVGAEVVEVVWDAGENNITANWWIGGPENLSYKSPHVVTGYNAQDEAVHVTYVLKFQGPVEVGHFA